MLAYYKVSDEKKNPHIEKCIDFEEKQTGGEKIFCAIEKTFQPKMDKVYFLRIVVPEMEETA